MSKPSNYDLATRLYRATCRNEACHAFIGPIGDAKDGAAYVKARAKRMTSRG